jgi:hypothetical protein
MIYGGLIMKNTFYRPEQADTREFGRIIAKIENDLASLLRNEVSKEAATAYVERIVYLQQPSSIRRDMVFWGLDEPKNMPSDARCDFLFRPTYIFSMFLVNAVLKYPDILNLIPNLSIAIEKGLNGSTARNFSGHGYDAEPVQLDNLEFFIKCNLLMFMKTYPKICLKFSEIFDSVIKSVEADFINGRHVFGFGTDCKAKQQRVLELRKEVL